MTVWSVLTNISDKLWPTAVFWGVSHHGTTTHLSTQQWSHSQRRLIRQQYARFILRRWTSCLCQCLDDGWSTASRLGTSQSRFSSVASLSITITWAEQRVLSPAFPDYTGTKASVFRQTYCLHCCHYYINLKSFIEFQSFCYESQYTSDKGIGRHLFGINLFNMLRWPECLAIIIVHSLCFKIDTWLHKNKSQNICFCNNI